MVSSEGDEFVQNMNTGTSASRKSPSHSLPHKLDLAPLPLRDEPRIYSVEGKEDTASLKHLSVKSESSHQGTRLYN